MPICSGSVIMTKWNENVSINGHFDIVVFLLVDNKSIDRLSEYVNMSRVCCCACITLYTQSTYCVLQQKGKNCILYWNNFLRLNHVEDAALFYDKRDTELKLATTNDTATKLGSFYIFSASICFLFQMINRNKLCWIGVKLRTLCYLGVEVCFLHTRNCKLFMTIYGQWSQ